jgi:phage RecT family recombinase
VSTAIQQNTTAAANYNRAVQRHMGEVLESLVGPERCKEAAGRFTLAFRVAAAKAPQLREAPPAQVAEAVALCALTGLMPGGPLPDCYLIPRKSKHPSTGKWTVPGLQWMLSFRGLRKLVERTGVELEVVPVFRGEDFAVRRGLDPTIEHVPDYMGEVERTWENLALVYVVARRGRKSPTRFEVISKADIEARRNSSDAWKRGGSSPWKDWPIEMALKTAVRYAVSRGLVPLDDIGTAAYQVDGLADAPREDIEVVDVREHQAEVRQLDVRRTGMAGLRDVVDEVATTRPLRPAPEPEPEPVVDEEKESEKARAREIAQRCADILGRLPTEMHKDLKTQADMQPTTSISRYGSDKLLALHVLLVEAEKAHGAKDAVDDSDPFGGE